ncbi:unnamed protein product [Camellia sinensis]
MDQTSPSSLQILSCTQTREAFKARERERERKMDPKLTEVSQLFERLKPLLFGMISILVPNSSLSSRVLLTKFRSLPPLFEETPNAVHELTLTRDICEHAVVLSVKIEDQGAFERDFF